MDGENKRSKHRMKKKSGRERRPAKNDRRYPRKGHSTSAKETPAPSRQVDPETAKYFSNISNLFENNEIDLDDYSTVCGNALEETRGKEIELATDPVVSRTLQRLLEGCDLDQLCDFVRGCLKGLCLIVSDMFGSHVIETAFKALAKHVQDEGSSDVIEEVLHLICRGVVGDAVKVMGCRYGSHVVRSLLCLCKGVPLDSIEEFHGAKRSTALSERLNFKSVKSVGNDSDNFQRGFPDVFRFLVREMLNRAKDEITSLRADSHSSLVLQTLLRLLAADDDDELLRAILIILRCDEKANAEGFIGDAVKHDTMELLEDTASSHLLEVIIKLAPETLYYELLNKVFKGSLFEISSHHCGNFVVQALISSARTKDQAELIWAELGAKLKELLEIGKSGVVASILAACQRLQSCAHECCHALAAAVSLEPESSTLIVPHLLFLDSYFREKSGWKWPVGDKMHLLGCLMLQTIFKYPNDIIQAYIASLTSMEDDQIYLTAIDAGGSHVLEAFLSSDVSTKRKLKIISKLAGHFGELSLHPSSSFTVEKCFTASNLSLKEIIAAELLVVQNVLSQKKHGPYLLKKLDIDGFARQPDQWKSSQAARESAYKEFQETFGSDRPINEVPQSYQKPAKRKHSKHDDATTPFSSPVVEMSEAPCMRGPKGGMSAGVTSGKSESKSFVRNLKGSSFSRKAGVTGGENESKSFVRNPKGSSFLRTSVKKKPADSSLVRRPGMRESSGNELVNLASKKNLSTGDVHKLFRTMSRDLL